MEPATGIIVQNRGAAFVLDPDSPSCLAPGRRPPHTLTPVMVRREGRLVCASGAMGGKAQPQIQAQILGRVLDLGLDAATAVSAPRWVVGGLEVGSVEHVVRLEARLSALRASFDNEGFETELLGAFDEEVGHAQFISFVGDEFDAAADPRSDGRAAAW
jgi:gamma-glutamyltranspeptidase/glutathione hydrolase